jgi:hypothetical protein
MLIARGFACEELLRIDRFCTDRAAWGDFAQGHVSHDVGRGDLAAHPIANQSMSGATSVWRATNASMRGQNHSVSCSNLCTIEMLAGE